MDDRPIKVGDEVPVGEHFWIGGAFVGFTQDACHGNGVRDGDGSADEKCHIRVLRIDGADAAAVLLRPEMPYGAAAPHGTIFRLSLKQIQSWPALIAARKARDARHLYDVQAGPFR